MADLVLFYSEQCEFSIDVLNDIRKNSLENQFIFVNIDNPSIKIPPFVEAVPLVFSKENKKLYIEDEIDKLLSEIKSQSKISSIMSASDQLKGLTDKFSFISDKDNNMGSRGYNSINSSDDKLTPVLTSSEGGSKFNESHYNTYLSQRDNDVASMFPRQNSVR